MPPPLPGKNLRQKHDPENPQLEEPCRIRPGGGHGHDPLFSRAISRGQYLSARNGSAVAVCIPGPEILIHPVPLLDSVYRLLRVVLRLVHFFPQGEAANSSWQVAHLPRPPEKRRSLPRRRGDSQSPKAGPRTKSSVARNPRKGFVHGRCRPWRNRE